MMNDFNTEFIKYFYSIYALLTNCFRIWLIFVYLEVLKEYLVLISESGFKKPFWLKKNQIWLKEINLVKKINLKKNVVLRKFGFKIIGLKKEIPEL